ncbi:MAG: hypothetical protein ACRDL5_19250 [Solirubrobacteraceae bacterium]
MSSLIESLAQTRHTERYNRLQGAGTPREDVSRRRDDVSKRQNTRSRAGWLLVGLGLRLALPGRQAAPRRITLIGR